MCNASATVVASSMAFVYVPGRRLSGLVLVVFTIIEARSSYLAGALVVTAAVEARVTLIVS